MASIGQAVSFRDKLYEAHRCLLDCNQWVRYTKDGYIAKPTTFPFDLSGSPEFKLAQGCHDLLTDMITMMEGDGNERRNDEPIKEGRVENKQPLE